jgi:hypothetical protein
LRALKNSGDGGPSNFNSMMHIDLRPELPFCPKDVKVKSTKAVITLLPPDFPPLVTGRGLFLCKTLELTGGME